MKLTEQMCALKFAELDVDLQRYIIAIVMELQSATEKHPGWPTDGLYRPVTNLNQLGGYVAAAAIVSEESGELIRAALQHEYEGGQYYAMHKEAIQTGAMALRFLIGAPEKEFSYEGE